MTQQTEVHVHIHPAFGEWIDQDVTPAMVRGKLLWLTKSITRVRKEMATAEDNALDAKHTFDDALSRAERAAVAAGATSKADAERTAVRASAPEKRAKEKAEMKVKHLRDELEDLYRSQMPATQSLNRIVLAENAAEWRTADLES